MSELTPILQALVKADPQPEKMLAKMLKDMLALFHPKTAGQCVSFLTEYQISSAKIAALLLANHVDDHPEEAKECCPELINAMKTNFHDMVSASLDMLCEEQALEFNPLRESTTNEDTRDAILKELDKDHG